MLTEQDTIKKTTMTNKEWVVFTQRSIIAQLRKKAKKLAGKAREENEQELNRLLRHHEYTINLSPEDDLFDFGLKE